MKNKKNLLMTGMMAVVMALALCGCGGGEAQTFDVSTGDDGVITVTAENAAGDSQGNGYVTLQSDEQIVKVEADLEEETSVELIFTDEADGKNHGQREVVGDEDTEFQMPAGEYMVQFIAGEGATGTLTVHVE